MLFSLNEKSRASRAVFVTARAVTRVRVCVALWRGALSAQLPVACSGRRLNIIAQLCREIKNKRRTNGFGVAIPQDPNRAFRPKGERLYIAAPGRSDGAGPRICAMDL